MKGVAAGICPDCAFIDITHQVAPHDVMHGALELGAAYRYFPKGTVFLAVVDPGVGSTRRGMAVESPDYRFVAPDNGLLTLVLDRERASRVVELTESRFFLASVSRTFEGRDRFAPCAAWLAAGTPLDDLGQPLTTPVRLEIPRPGIEEARIVGEVLRIDHFGNLITNIDRPSLEVLAARGSVVAQTNGREHIRLVTTYAEIPAGEVGLLIGSSDFAELAAQSTSAGQELGAKVGDRVICHVHSDRGPA
jgi:S-adenosyl-L-methionine hydrolase (adenosine-forming)